MCTTRRCRKNMNCTSNQVGAFAPHGRGAQALPELMLGYVMDDDNAPVPQEYELYF